MYGERPTLRRMHPRGQAEGTECHETGYMAAPGARLVSGHHGIFLPVAFRHGRNPGKIAAARRLLDLVYHLLKEEEDYQAPIARAASSA